MYSLRRTCQAPCVINFDGTNYHGIIENVSLSGTLIKLVEPAVDIKPGDRCGLMLCGDEAPHMLHTCRVIRTEDNHIGLELLELGC